MRMCSLSCSAGPCRRGRRGRSSTNAWRSGSTVISVGLRRCTCEGGFGGFCNHEAAWRSDRRAPLAFVGQEADTTGTAARVCGDVPVSATALELLAGVAADLAIGDPRWMPHPIRGFGWLAQRLEWLAECLPQRRVAGVVFWMSAVGLAGAAVWASMILL